MRATASKDLRKCRLKWLGLILSLTFYTLWQAWAPYIRSLRASEVVGLTKSLSQLDRGQVEWHACETIKGPFECGTLIAPLDYTSPSDSRNASLALIRYKAGGGSTKRSDVMGSVIFNPGGPGGSGVAFLSKSRRDSRNLTVSESLDEILHSKYDLVSFDPRGVGNTWPIVHCFEDPYSDLLYEATVAINGGPGDHSHKILKSELGTSISESHLLGDVCFNRNDSHLFKYMGTPFVARDMQLLHLALGDSKLNYWGFSYGTVLGSTYADMFPEDVGRIVIDGVVDVPNYYLGEWSTFLKDTEAELNEFFNECFNSGEVACKLSKLGSSGKELRDVVLDYVYSLKTRPLPVAEATPPQILTYTSVIRLIFQALYSPSSWPSLTDKLYAAIAEHKPGELLTSIDMHPVEYSEAEAIFAIACGDAHTDAPPSAEHRYDENSTAWDISDFERHLKPILNDSQHFGSLFGSIGLMCESAWQTRAAERHFGNFTSQTAFPILALGNDYDPVTPGKYADMMAKRFPGAVSVRREGYGHCSISQPSSCIADAVSAYFLEGKIPEPGLRCGVDEPIFSSKSYAIADAVHSFNDFSKWRPSA